MNDHGEYNIDLDGAFRHGRKIEIVAVDIKLFFLTILFFFFNFTVNGQTVDTIVPVVPDSLKISNLKPLNKTLTGYFVEKNKSGIIAKEGYKRKKVLDGEVRKYYNGKLNVIESWKAGVKEGTEIIYYGTGDDDMVIQNWTGGKLNGQCLKFADKKILEVYVCENGMKNGLYKVYDEGKVVEEGNYRDDYRVGEWRQFVNGKLTDEGDYLNGKKNGVWKYYRNGKLNIERSYVNGVKEGTWKYYDDNGNVESIRVWKNGVEEK